MVFGGISGVDQNSSCVLVEFLTGLQVTRRKPSRIHRFESMALTSFALK